MMNSVIFFVAALSIAGLFGYWIGRYANSAQKRLEKTLVELNSVREELDTYRAKVSHHFKETAELMEKLTKQYQKLYQHFAVHNQELTQTEQWKTVAHDEKMPSIEESIQSQTPRDYAQPKLPNSDVLAQEKAS